MADPLTAPHPDPPSHEPRPWLWALLAVAAPLLALRGLFSSSHLFYLRDLASEYWPNHLWFRRTVFSGQSPLWDPFVAFGQSAVSDPTRQLLFPPTLLLRLLLPDVLGFNLSVALPFPLAALGAFLLARRRLSPSAAALGSLLFALSGPVLSTGNFLNMSWSVACVPWAIWAVDRLAERASPGRVAALAAAIALQAAAGEPVTLAGTAVLAGAYAIAAVGGTARARLALAAVTALAGVAGLLLAAAQTLPLLDAAGRSLRSVGVGGRLSTMWALHPLSLVEAVMPQVFGHYAVEGATGSPWLPALNDGFEPCLLSVYVGPSAVFFGLLGASARNNRRWSFFWLAVFAVSLVCALGRYTPLYVALQDAFPPIRSFRFPAKYAVFAAAALSMLAAAGWDAFVRAARDGATRRPLMAVAWLAGATAAIASGAAFFALLVPESTFDVVARLGASAGVVDPSWGAHYLLATAGFDALRLALLAGGTAALLLAGASTRREAPRARIALFCLVALDLVAANSGLNPTMEASRLSEPAWVAATREHPSDRVYVGKRAAQAVVGPPDFDDGFPAGEDLLSDDTPPERAAIENVAFALTPSPWRAREAISHDYNLLWPREYTAMLRRFRVATPDERARFLARAAARYRLLPHPPLGASRMVATGPGDAQFALFEVEAGSGRAAVVSVATVEPSIERQTQRMFEEGFDPSAEVLLSEEPPAAAGQAGEPEAPSARLLEDGATRVVVEAAAGEGGGYLLLLDSFDPHWKAEVDGLPAPLLRADGLFRAVRIAPGRHSVAFAYRPVPLYAGLALSLATALALATALLLARRSARRQLHG